MLHKCLSLDWIHNLKKTRTKVVQRHFPGNTMSRYTHFVSHPMSNSMGTSANYRSPAFRRKAIHHEGYSYTGYSATETTASQYSQGGLEKGSWSLRWAMKGTSELLGLRTCFQMSGDSTSKGKRESGCFWSLKIMCVWSLRIYEEWQRWSWGGNRRPEVEDPLWHSVVLVIGKFLQFPGYATVSTNSINGLLIPLMCLAHSSSVFALAVSSAWCLFS